MSEPAVKIGMAPSHPGEIVTEFLSDLHLTVTAAAAILGVRRATLSDLVNGNAALSAEMALRIEKAFGPKMEVLLRLQARYDAYTMRQHADAITVARYAPAATIS
jgi:addiction module HigA family antidote